METIKNKMFTVQNSYDDFTDVSLLVDWSCFVPNPMEYVHKLIRYLQLPESREILSEKNKKLYQSNFLAHHAYIASEFIYHVWGKKHGFKPHYIKYDAFITHWFLKNPLSEDIIDITLGQYPTGIAEDIIYTGHDTGVCTGFLTKEPSKRTKLVMQKLSIK